MAKGDDKRVRNAISTETNRMNTQGNQLFGQFNEQYGQARAQDSELRSGLQNNLLNFKPTYDADSYLNASGYSSGGGVSDGGAGGLGVSIARGIDPSKIAGMGAEAYGGYRDMASGLKQPFWNDYRNWEGQLQNAATGYQNFANTGGFSQGDLDAISAQALAPTRAVFQQTQDNAKRLAASSGNAGSLGAALGRMAREGNQAISDASVSNQANMAQLQQQGKLAGLQGLASTSGQAMSARTQVEALDHQMRAAGLGGMTDIEKTRLMAELENQSITQRGDIAAAQLAESAAGRSASASAASRADAMREAAFRAGLDELGNEQYLKAQGLGIDLYGTTPGATQLANRSLLDLYGTQGQLNQGLIGQRISGAQLPGKFQSAMGNIGSAVNLAGSVINPLGSLGRGNPGSRAGSPGGQYLG